MPYNDSLFVTTRGQYALMALVELVGHNDNHPIPLSIIAEQKNISLSYLEQLFAGLRKHGIVRSYRGPGGGYMLAKAAIDISVSDVLRAAEDSAPAKRQKKSGKKQKYPQDCPTLTLWGEVGSHLLEVMTQISLSDVANKQADIHKTVSNLVKK